ncbi:MAG: response regulator [Planctomycetes bacterium]|nr:response regulator [Planctomycetota bacterium]
MTAKILLVDDVDEVRNSLAQMLARRYDVKTASNAGEAIRAFATDGPFPVVISDYAMPGMDGLELLREVHAHSPETVGVLLTGVSELDLAVAAVHARGVYRFLSKPAGYETLVRAIDEALAHHTQLEDTNITSERLLFAKESFECLTETLENRIHRSSEALRRLHAFTKDLCSAANLQQIVDVAAQAASEVLGGRGVHVQVWDDSAQRAAVEAGAGPEMSTNMHYEPLDTRDGKIGEIVVDLGGRVRRPLDTVDGAMLASIAASTAVAARNEFKSRERDRAQHATILALAHLAEQRDNETGRHLERVAAYSRLVAEGLREDGFHRDLITDQWVHDLERSSALHDIGKVGVPDSILLKPGKLTPQEWEIMKSHADLGARTLDTVMQHFAGRGFLAMGRDIAASHHEKWDGSGYPRGLKETQIPLSARILALADVYDALTSVRPYKGAWTHEAALEWIVSRAGVHFDPDVVTVFARRANLATAIRARLQDPVVLEQPDVLTRPA